MTGRGPGLRIRHMDFSSFFVTCLTQHSTGPDSGRSGLHQQTPFAKACKHHPDQRSGHVFQAFDSISRSLVVANRIRLLTAQAVKFYQTLCVCFPHVSQNVSISREPRQHRNWAIDPG